MAEDKKPEDGSTTATPAGAEASPPPADALANPGAASGINTSPIASDEDKAKAAEANKKSIKKIGAVKKFTKIFNVYILLFLVLIAAGGAVAAYEYMNSRKTTPPLSVTTQKLTTDQLKQLANSNATVGGSGQTVTIQGNAVFSGSVLVRSNLQVAGDIQLGSNLDVAQLNVTNSSNLAKTQANTLQVAGTTTFQGLVTIQNGATITGNTNINTATIGTITANKVIMSGNAQLQIPNHISFGGSTSPHVSGLNGNSATIIGSDTSGTVTVTTGGGGAGCMASLTFAQAYFNSKPNVIISLESSSPANVQYYAGSLSTAGFQVCSANAPPSNSQLAFSYFITASSPQ
jgi:hypothetical protein